MQGARWSVSASRRVTAAGRLHNRDLAGTVDNFERIIRADVRSAC